MDVAETSIWFGAGLKAVGVVSDGLQEKLSAMAVQHEQRQLLFICFPASNAEYVLLDAQLFLGKQPHTGSAIRLGCGPAPLSEASVC